MFFFIPFAIVTPLQKATRNRHLCQLPLGAVTALMMIVKNTTIETKQHKCDITDIMVKDEQVIMGQNEASRWNWTFKGIDLTRVISHIMRSPI